MINSGYPDIARYIQWNLGVFKILNVSGYECETMCISSAIFWFIYLYIVHTTESIFVVQSLQVINEMRNHIYVDDVE